LGGLPLLPSQKRGNGAPTGAAILYVRAPFPMRGAFRRAIAALGEGVKAFASAPGRLSWDVA